MLPAQHSSCLWVTTLIWLLQVLCSTAYPGAEAGVLHQVAASPVSSVHPAPASEDALLPHQWLWGAAQQHHECGDASLTADVIGKHSGHSVAPPTPPAVSSQPLSVHSAVAASQAASGQAGGPLSTSNTFADGALSIMLDL